MRALLINPTDCTITEVEWNGDYRNINEHIHAHCFDGVRLGDKNRNTIYVDDEGLINGKWQQDGMFRVDGEYPTCLAGRGLILGTNGRGESTPCDLVIEEFKSRIMFGKPVRINNALYFLELAKGEEPSVYTATHNRRWYMED